MSGGLPAQIDPLDLARKQVELEGAIAFAEMPRLADYGNAEKAAFKLKFGLAPGSENLAVMTGRINATVELVCERCLEPFDMNFELHPELYFDASGAQIDEQDERDIIGLEGDIALKSLVEDEILLALPMIPMHAPDQCRTRGEAGGSGQQQENDGQRADNPFSKLKALKGQGKLQSGPESAE